MYDNFSPFQSYGNIGGYSPYPSQFSQPQQSQNMRDSYSGGRNLGTNSNLIFVESIEEVERYGLNPNCTFLFMDSKNKRFYVKSTDNLGIANITSYTFNEFKENSSNEGQDSPEVPQKFEVSESDYNNLVKKVTELEDFRSNIETKLNDLI